MINKMINKMDMKKTGFAIGKCFIILMLGSVAGAFLLTLSYMLPLNSEMVDKTIKILSSEKEYLQVSSLNATREQWEAFLLPDVLDTGTDKLMLYTAMEDSEGSPLRRAMNAYNPDMGNYSYYWHGYVCILRALLLFFDYSEIRVINCAVQLFLVFLLAFLIGKKRGTGYVLMFAASFMLLMPMTLPLSLQYTWVFYIAHIALLIFIYKQEYFSFGDRYIFYFLVTGMFTSYLDLLTYPLFTWGMPLVWWMVFSDEEKGSVLWIKQVVVSGISWIAGYGGMWVMKWVFATWILGRNIFESAYEEILLRSGAGLDEGSGILGDRLNAVYLNWKHYEYKIYALILAGWLLWWIFCSLRKREWVKDSRRAAYFLVGLSGIVWCFVLANHTRGHNYFTYRVYGVSVLAFLALVLCSTSKEKGRPKIVFRRSAAAIVLFLTAAVSFFLMRQAREELIIMNGMEEFRTIAVGDGTIEMEFSPAFDVIRRFSVGLDCEGGDGICLLTVWEDGEPKYQETYSIADFGEANYHGKTVNWKLSHRKQYRMTLEMKGTTKPVNVWVTNGVKTMDEWRRMSINGVNENGQILSGILYWGCPANGGTGWFIVMTWTGILLAAVYAALPDRLFVGKV